MIIMAIQRKIAAAMVHFHNPQFVGQNKTPRSTTISAFTNNQWLTANN
jgi:hypothetical protein